MSTLWVLNPDKGLSPSCATHTWGTSTSSRFSGMQVMQVGAIKLRALPTFVGSQSSNFLGDGKNASFSSVAFAKQSSKAALLVSVRAVYPGGPLPGYRPPSDEPPFPVPSSMPPSAPVSTSVPPPTRTTTPNRLAGPQGTNAEPPTVSPDFQGAAALGLPELDLPEPPSSVTSAPPTPPPQTTSRGYYRGPYSRSQPPPRSYEPAKTTNSKVIEWLNPPPPPTELMQREQFKLSDTCSMTIYFGDITKWHVNGESDAIVAPANKKVNAGAAVDGVIHKVAGPRLLSACQRLPDVAPQGIKCEVGNAVSTRAFNLHVVRIIHAVGPVYEGRESDPDLEKTYMAALALAAREGVKHIVFPALSCRIYGYPYSEGAEVALRTLKINCQGFSQIDIVVRNIEGYEAFIDEAHRVLEEIKERRTIPMPATPQPA